MATAEEEFFRKAREAERRDAAPRNRKPLLIAASVILLCALGVLIFMRYKEPERSTRASTPTQETERSTRASMPPASTPTPDREAHPLPENSKPIGQDMVTYEYDEDAKNGYMNPKHIPIMKQFQLSKEDSELCRLSEIPPLCFFLAKKLHVDPIEYYEHERRMYYGKPVGWPDWGHIVDNPPQK